MQEIYDFKSQNSISTFMFCELPLCLESRLHIIGWEVV